MSLSKRILNNNKYNNKNNKNNKTNHETQVKAHKVKAYETQPEEQDLMDGGHYTEVVLL